jgi:hypothetical protein
LFIFVYFFIALFIYLCFLFVILTSYTAVMLDSQVMMSSKCSEIAMQD